MSEGTPNDPNKPRMPWEPEPPADDAAPPSTSPDSGWTPPSPTDPTTVWTPAPSADTRPPTPPPWQPAPPDQGGLISSAPVGWAAPRAAAEVAPGLAVADTTSRVVAYIVDLIILGFVNAILGSILNPAPAVVTDLNDLMVSIDPVTSVITVLIDAAYFVVSWTGGRRATIGQRLFSMQVGNAFDGRALTLEQAIRRWLGLGSWIALSSIIPGALLLSVLIGLLWNIVLLITTATSPTKQGLHDRFANTALVRPAGQGTSGLATACLVIVVILVLLVVISVIALIALGSQVSDILSRVGESI